MIIAIGSDIVDIRRIENALERFGKRFAERIFTANEQVYAKGDAGKLAKRFAAKEACAKALGTGLGRVSWQDIEVLRQPGQAPRLALHGEALKRLAQITPSGKSAQLLVTLSDEYPYAQAFVVIAAADA
jgi:holo-[acyl-carrier protein] synthase